MPHIRSGAGAVATQAFVNPHYGPTGLDMLARGATAESTVAALVARDMGRDHRQVHVMDRSGRAAAYTGAQCVDWCGSAAGPQFSIAGNMLAGPAVIEATARALETARGLPFARRLIAAMQAGEAAGGDKRGRQSAALLVHDSETYPLLDLRVDDHADPLTELARLEGVARERFVHFRRQMPRRDAPSGLTDRGELDTHIARSIAEGYE